MEWSHRPDKQLYGRELEQKNIERDLKIIDYVLNKDEVAKEDLLDLFSQNMYPYPSKKLQHVSKMMKNQMNEQTEYSRLLLNLHYSVN